MRISFLENTFLAMRFSLFALMVATAISGCSGRAFTPPRSQLVEESASGPNPLPSPDEERQAFYSVDEANQKRLLKLIRQRSAVRNNDDSYHLGVGDQVEIAVFDVPELNLSVRIRESGMLSLPLIGAVRASGRTEQELAQELKTRLSSFVRQPQVTVFITEYGSQKVAVLGAVTKPGSYPLKKSSNSLLDLISEAGGINQHAGNFVNFVPAEVSGLSATNDVESRARIAMAADAAGTKVSGIEVYLDQIMGTSGGIPIEVPVRGGDMLIVPEAGKVMVEGEVQKPGQFELGQQMTVLGALAAAGGITYGAKIDEIELIRESASGDKAHLIIDLTKVAKGEDKDVRLRNGDIVRIPSDSGRRMRQDTFDALGKVINLGVGGTVNVVP